MEQQIKITAKLYECRDVLKRLLKEEFKPKIQEYQKYIKGAMLKHNLDELQAAMKLVDDIKETEGAGVGSMYIFAAVVEMIEPSKD